MSLTCYEGQELNDKRRVIEWTGYAPQGPEFSEDDRRLGNGVVSDMENNIPPDPNAMRRLLMLTVEGSHQASYFTQEAVKKLGYDALVSTVTIGTESGTPEHTEIMTNLQRFEAANKTDALAV